MKDRFKLLLGVLSVSMLGILAGPAAVAQCGAPAKKAAFHANSLANRGSFQLASLNEDRDQDDLEPIVGLWKIAFVDKSKGYTDTGYAAWHSDFTEFQNSQRTPSTGAVCQGVWEKVGRFTYRLNHFAMAYADNVNLTNIIRIREEVTVDKSQKTFSGTFTTDVYDTQHNLIVEFQGPITGTRVTIDSSIDSQLSTRGGVAYAPPPPCLQIDRASMIDKRPRTAHEAYS